MFAQWPDDDDLRLKIPRRHYWPNKWHIHRYRMFQLNGQHILHNRCHLMDNQGTTVLLFFCQSAGCSLGPFCQDQDHFALPARLARTTFLEQSSNVHPGLGGSGAWTWKLILRCSLRPILSKMQYVQPAPNFFLWLPMVFSTLKRLCFQCNKRDRCWNGNRQGWP